MVGPKTRNRQMLLGILMRFVVRQPAVHIGKSIRQQVDAKTQIGCHVMAKRTRKFDGENGPWKLSAARPHVVITGKSIKQPAVAEELIG